MTSDSLHRVIDSAYARSFASLAGDFITRHNSVVCIYDIGLLMSYPR